MQTDAIAGGVVVAPYNPPGSPATGSIVLGVNTSTGALAATWLWDADSLMPNVAGAIDKCQVSDGRGLCSRVRGGAGRAGSGDSVSYLHRTHRLYAHARCAL